MKNATGQDGLLSDLYREYIGALRRFLTGKLKCTEAAADAAQDVFLQLLSVRTTVAFRNPKGLVFRAARNRAIDYFRAAKSRPERPGTCIPEEDRPGGAPDPEHVVDLRQQLSILEAAIAELPPKCRRVFVLHRFGGVTQAQIANDLGISRQMVEKHLVAALTHLRAKLPE